MMHLPPPLQRLYDAWMRFAHILGRIMSFILLSLLWLFGFGVYGIVLRVVTYLRPKPTLDSYWIDVPPKMADDMRHQC